MAGKISAEMRKALDLIKKGATATEAAKKAKISRQAIYRNAEYIASRPVKAVQLPKEECDV